MLKVEADWIASYLSKQDKHSIGLVLNVGSSTRHFRECVQPHIHDQIFAPLNQQGIAVVHADIKSADGVTIAADILDDRALHVLRKQNARTILCSNVLEHVPCPKNFADRLSLLVPTGGRLIVTTPNSYPYHPDPIDTLFRPTIDELRELFWELELSDSAVVSGPNLLDEFRSKPFSVPRRVIRTMLPIPNFHGWLSTIDRWRWLFHTYKAVCAVFIRA